MGIERFTNLGKITTPFGGKTEQEEFHPGVDIAARRGTPIHAAAGGVVLQTIDGKPHGDNSFGNSVMIKDKKGNIHRYSHLAKIAVRPGQKVSDKQVVATVGDSGATYSPSGGPSDNLDYRIVNAFGQLINPVQYIDKL